MTELYGIPNCATVKKARAWLEEQGIAYTFHDFKKTPPSETWLLDCLKTVSQETLLNKRGTTWRKLTPEQQAQAETQIGAIALMQTNPSVIKRPVLQVNGQTVVGFNLEQYAEIFQAA
ncbi:MAG: arsenate reductase [Alysiella sp.]|uniref:arsenate reductase n=1 Tax=Alysiella sp. TaxID=1872483 RepID=UPI0026DC4491|nr:arsenate reductase [Alysiella sp.]MDO4434260.1 arsenate reductase [Alysiella sp.]